MNTIGPSVIATQKSQTATSSTEPSSCPNAAGGRTWRAAGGEGRWPRANRRTSGGETSTSSGLTGPRKRSGAGAPSKVARLSRFEKAESSLVRGTRRPVAPWGLGSGETANDPAGVLFRSGRRLHLRHDASPVAGLDRFAQRRRARQLHVLDVLPAGTFDRDYEPLHLYPAKIRVSLSPMRASRRPVPQ